MPTTATTPTLESINPATGEVAGSVPVTPVDAVSSDGLNMTQFRGLLRKRVVLNPRGMHLGLKGVLN